MSFPRLSFLYKARTFSVQFSLRPTPLNNSDILDNPIHPIRARLLARNRQRAHSLLIYVIATKAAISKHSTIRHRAKRRLIEATRQALREVGYSYDGFPDFKGDVHDEWKRRIEGTIAYWPKFEVVNEEWESLKEDVRKTVKAFLRKKEEEWRGKPQQKKGSFAGTPAQGGERRPPFQKKGDDVAQQGNGKKQWRKVGTLGQPGGSPPANKDGYFRSQIAMRRAEVDAQGAPRSERGTRSFGNEWKSEQMQTRRPPKDGDRVANQGSGNPPKVD